MPAVITNAVSSRHIELVAVVHNVIRQTVSPTEGEPALLPNGAHAAICSNGALYLRTLIGGDVYGYSHADNPSARLGAGKDGHDFLLVEGRYIVDLWACDYEGLLPDGVIDLSDPAQALLVRELYGEPGTWQLVLDSFEVCIDDQPASDANTPHLLRASD